MNQKTCLFLKASAAACAKEEGAITAILEGLGVLVVVVEWLSPDDFVQQVAGKKFDILYLGAHADGWGFGDKSTFHHDWKTLGNAICTAACMIPEGTLFLGCCRGGMKTVALKILKECDKIDYICGPNWNTKGGDLVTAFATFMRNRLGNGEEPAMAVKRTSEAAGQTFNCFDRQELEADIELLRNIEQIQTSQAAIIRSQQALVRQLETLQASVTGLAMFGGFAQPAPFDADLCPEDFMDIPQNCCPEEFTPVDDERP